MYIYIVIDYLRHVYSFKFLVAFYRIRVYGYEYMDTSKQIYFAFYLIATEIKEILFVEDSCLECSICVR